MSPGHESSAPPCPGRGLDEARLRGHRAAQVDRGAAGGADSGSERQTSSDRCSSERTRVKTGAVTNVINIF